MTLAPGGMGPFAPQDGADTRPSSMGFVALGLSDLRSANGMQQQQQQPFSRSSILSLATGPTTGDVDDEIMEGLELELFDGEPQFPSGSRSAGLVGGSRGMRAARSRPHSATPHSCAVLSPAEIAALSAGFSRLPDRPGSACSGAAARGGGGGAAAPAATASEVLTEVLRCSGAGIGPVTSLTSPPAVAVVAAARPGLVAVDPMSLPAPAGASHDGVVMAPTATRRAGDGGDGAFTVLRPAVATVGYAGGGLSDAPTTAFSTADAFGMYSQHLQQQIGHPPELWRTDPRAAGAGASHSATAVMQRESSLQEAVAQGQLRAATRLGGQAGGLRQQPTQHYPYAQAGLPHHQQQEHLLPAGFHSYHCDRTPSSSNVQPLPNRCLSGSASQSEGAAGGRGAPASPSVTHPALAQVIASAAGGGGVNSTASAMTASLSEELNPSAGGGVGGGAATAADPLGWDLSAPIGPCPVPVAQPRFGRFSASAAAASSYSPYTFSGSIAAAAFRSGSAISGTPSLAAPARGGVPSTPDSLTSDAVREPTVNGFRTISDPDAAAAAAAPFFAKSECWTSASPQLPTASADSRPHGGGSSQRLLRHGGAAGGGVPPEQLFSVLPDAGTGGAAAAAAAAAGVVGDDSVAAAVRALLHLGSALDLPCTQATPPSGDFEAVTGQAAAASGADGARVVAAADGAAGGGAFAPSMPPPGPLPALPLPASVLESVEPSGVPAVDRYLQQLLLDPSAERHVFLCKRPLGAAACRAIASCLRVCPGVRSITLSYCCITCEGLTALCDGLRSCRDLLVLDLSYNAISDLGVAALATALPDMPALASLSLVGNAELADAGVAALAAAARGCTALRRVGLRGTAVGQLGLRDMAAALAGNLRRAAAAARRNGSGGGGTGSPVRGGGGGGVYGDRPVTWDGTLGSGGGGGANGDGVFIAQLCALLRTLVQPALAAEQAVAEAVAELMAAAPAYKAAAVADGVAAPRRAAGSAKTASGGESGLLSYLADGLTARGYDVAVTHALGGGPGGECLRNLRHTFLSVTAPPPPPGAVASGPASPAAAAVTAASLARGGVAARGGADAPAVPYHPGVIIVDPELKEQFEVAMPTPRYEALVSALPQVYVGAEERLPLVVEVLCDEMALALRSKGLVIPPWRESAAMISKWQPKQSKLLVPAGGGAAAVTNGSGLGGAAADASTAAAGASDPASVRSTCSSGPRPRVSLAGGMAATGGAPVPVHWRRSSGGGGGEPSLGPALSLTSAASGSRGSRVDSHPMGQSFGFRRHPSGNGYLSGSVGMSVGLAPAPIAQIPAMGMPAAKPPPAIATAAGGAMPQVMVTASAGVGGGGGVL